MNNWFDETRYASVQYLQNIISNSKLLTPPMLMLPWKSPCSDDDMQIFYSFVDNRYYDLPVPRNLWCIGSSRGWLILADRSATLTLLNPMSRIRIQLPPARGLRQLVVTYADLARRGHDVAKYSVAWEKLSMHRVVLSCDPKFSRHFSLVIIFGEGTAAMYKSETENWIPLQQLHQSPWLDAVFHRGDLYTVSRNGVYNHANGKTWEIRESIWEGNRYLVETPDGDLFLVIREYECDFRLPGVNPRRRTTGFSVYMRQPLMPDNAWLPTRSLNGYVLFVGKGTSFALLSTYTGRPTGDLIYFLNRDNDSGPVPSLRSDCGVFCLQEGRMRPPSDRPRPSPQHLGWQGLLSPAAWVAPTAVDRSSPIQVPDEFVKL